MVAAADPNEGAHLPDDRGVSVTDAPSPSPNAGPPPQMPSSLRPNLPQRVRPGRTASRRRQAFGSAQKAITANWMAAAAITKAWKTSW